MVACHWPALFSMFTFFHSTPLGSRNLMKPSAVSALDVQLTGMGMLSPMVAPCGLHNISPGEPAGGGAGPGAGVVAGAAAGSGVGSSVAVAAAAAAPEP